MALKVIKPTWKAVGSGLSLARAGTLLLEFAPAVAGQQQQYSWDSKEVRWRLAGWLAGWLAGAAASPQLAEGRQRRRQWCVLEPPPPPPPPPELRGGGGGGDGDAAACQTPA